MFYTPFLNPHCSSIIKGSLILLSVINHSPTINLANYGQKTYSSVLYLYTVERLLCLVVRHMTTFPCCNIFMIDNILSTKSVVVNSFYFIIFLSAVHSECVFGIHASRLSVGRYPLPSHYIIFNAIHCFSGITPPPPPPLSSLKLLPCLCLLPEKL